MPFGECSWISDGLGNGDKLLKRLITGNVNKQRGFLGLASCCKRLIKDFSIRAETLQRLLEKNKTYWWRSEHQRTFHRLISYLSIFPILALTECENQFSFDTDSSKTRIDVVLSKNYTDGFERAVAFFSRLLLKPERQYTTIKNRLLELIATIKHFRSYVYGWKFQIRNDNAALQ